ncbi:MAG: archaetidylserine decarboxylase [Pseudomonadota bacterium]|nr:archaetidylserine decarboxylase [Pseudomonadota bacterium]
MYQSLLPLLLRFVPKNYLSYFLGRLAAIRWPFAWNKKLILWFSNRYGINLDEVEKDVSQYPSLSDFFVRRLKSGVRPIANGIVHPADSTITTFGPIDNQTLIQAKGLNYDLSEFVHDLNLAAALEGGTYITYYLCPADYHCVHSPIDGKVIKATHIPGELWPVNTWSVKSIKNLFPRNERLVVEMDYEGKRAVLVMVGATNVGKITLAFDDTLVTNDLSHRKPRTRFYNPSIGIKRGDLFGKFHLGSTVIMLYQEGILPTGKVISSVAVKYGESL